MHDSGIFTELKRFNRNAHGPIFSRVLGKTIFSQPITYQAIPATIRPANIPSGISLTPDSIVIALVCLASEYTYPSYCTFARIVILSIFVSEKALSPIEVTFSGICIFLKLIHSPKAFLPIVEIFVLLILITVIFGQDLNALAPMLLIPSRKINDFIFFVFGFIFFVFYF